MELFIKIAAFLHELTKKQFQQYLAIFLGSVCLVIGITSYWIYQQSNNLLQEIKKIETLSNKAIKILADNERMQQEERHIKDIFDQNKDFNITSFFEKFCKDNSLNPEPNWSPRVGQTNDRYEEIELTATFKGQTTEKIVKILAALDQKDIVYFKELTLKNEGDKKINFVMTIATKIMKKGFEQKGL